VFAGTEHYPESTMTDNYFAAWSGRTIKYIDDNVSPSLAHRPNIILLHAGTNDMNPNHAVSKEGNDPVEAAERLGDLLDHLIRACPDAVIVVATIIGTCNVLQAPQTAKLQYLIPGIVESRADDGHHVLSANFSGWSSSDLRDCIHPTNDGYAKLGEYWYDAMTKIPPSWISAPVGPDPERPPEDSGSVRSKAIGPSQALSVLFVVWFHGFWW
jgi:lysophospholipase L1-like esterase